jgi:aspartate ammonia-lyase
VASIGAVRELHEALAGLQGSCQAKEQAFDHVVVLGRTELVDAVPLGLGRIFGGFAEAFARDRWRTAKCEERLRVVNLGGTAVGTGLTAPRDYIFLAIEKLREVTGLGLARAENLVDATANADPFAETAGILGATAANLRKVSADLRLMHAASEIELPAVQAGSSVMPAKVNPVIVESVIQAALLAQSSVRLVTECVSCGTLQINEYLPLIGVSLLDAVRILRNAAAMLRDHLDRVTVNEEECRRRVDASTGLITAFVPDFGYDRCCALAGEFRSAGGKSVRAFMEERFGAEFVATRLAPHRTNALGHVHDADNA